MLTNNEEETSAMPTKKRFLAVGLILTLIILVACGDPSTLPEGPTPIPTLFPVAIPVINLQPTSLPVLLVESFPAGLPAASDGQASYNEHCASCHGDDGKGLQPNARDFGDLDYIRGETPAEFYAVISEGRGQEMPEFGSVLSSDERWDIVYYLWRFSTEQETLARGQDIYSSSCIACHGEDGQSMILGAANLSDPRFTSHQSPSDYYVIVTQGKGSMPAWQARLSQNDRWAVIDYLRAFNYDPNLVGEISLAEAELTQDAGPDCTPYEDLTNPFDWDDAEAITAGQELYVNCEGCHAEDGSGEIPGIIDFTNPLVRGDLLENANTYLCNTAEGFNAMLGWKDTLTNEQMWQILTYVADLGQ
jgi:mono/diheme cytochrome c family protein